MTVHTFYIHTVSGDIATHTQWLDDYEYKYDVEIWHGKPAKECDPKNWIKDGKIEPIEIISNDEYSLSNREFPGWFGDASEGEKYYSEWVCCAKDEYDNSYEIYWTFPTVKGEEPEDDEWPWEDESFISKIEYIG